MSEMKTTLIIAGQMSAALSNSINTARKGLGSLGSAGTDAQQKLAAIGTIDANQMKLRGATDKLRTCIQKLQRAREDLTLSDNKSEAAQKKLERRVKTRPPRTPNRSIRFAVPPGQRGSTEME